VLAASRSRFNRLPYISGQRVNQDVAVGEHSLAGLCTLARIVNARLSVSSRSKQIVRLSIFMGLLCLETTLVIGFYIVPQYQARNAPVGHWEMETPLRNSPGLWVALIAILGLLILGNIGLMVMIRRAFKELRIKN
jgi:hypothetical protein